MSGAFKRVFIGETIIERAHRDLAIAEHLLLQHKYQIDRSTSEVACNEDRIARLKKFIAEHGEDKAACTIAKDLT